MLNDSCKPNVCFARARSWFALTNTCTTGGCMQPRAAQQGSTPNSPPHGHNDPYKRWGILLQVANKQESPTRTSQRTLYLVAQTKIQNGQAEWRGGGGGVLLAFRSVLSYRERQRRRQRHPQKQTTTARTGPVQLPSATAVLDTTCHETSSPITKAGTRQPSCEGGSYGSSNTGA